MNIKIDTNICICKYDNVYIGGYISMYIHIWNVLEYKDRHIQRYVYVNMIMYI
jgi:hypothetical protein